MAKGDGRKNISKVHPCLGDLVQRSLPEQRGLQPIGDVGEPVGETDETFRQFDWEPSGGSLEGMAARMDVGVERAPRRTVKLHEWIAEADRRRSDDACQHVARSRKVLGGLLRVEAQLGGESLDVRVGRTEEQPSRAKRCFELQAKERRSALGSNRPQ